MKGKNTRKRISLDRQQLQISTIALQEFHQENMNPEGSDGAFGDTAPVGATHSVLVPPPASIFAFVNFTEDVDIHARRMLCTCRLGLL